MATRRPYLLIVVLALAACGGAAKKTVSPRSLDAAVRKTQAQASEHVAINAAVDLSGQQVSITGSGAFAKGKGALHATFNLPAVGSSTVDEAFDQNTYWIRSPLLKGGRWQRFSVKQSAGPFGLDSSLFDRQTPAGALSLLQLDNKLTSLGSQTMAGVETTHYHLDWGMTSGDTLYKSADAWVDSQNLVRRVKLDLVLNASSTKAGATVTMTFSNFGAPVHVTLPAGTS